MTHLEKWLKQIIRGKLKNHHGLVCPTAVHSEWVTPSWINGKTHSSPAVVAHTPPLLGIGTPEKRGY